MAGAHGSDDDRPKPAYGEYAPEGWEWKPEEHSADAPTPGAAPATGTTPAAAATPGTIPGVPHNLGAGSALPPRGSGRSRGHAAPPSAPPSTPSEQPGAEPRSAAAPRSSSTQDAAGAPYRAPAPEAQAPRLVPPAATPGAPGAVGYPAAPSAPKRAGSADRIVTILLLVLGLFGALQSGFAMINLRSNLNLIAVATNSDSITVPTWIDLTGKAVGIVLLALYGIVLVYSIRRMRAGKLAFWVPLAAGAIVTVLVFAVVFIAIITTPDLMNAAANPETSSELLDYLQGRQRS